MSTSSTWPKLLPPLGVLLALALVGAAGAVWWNGCDSSAGDGGLGELVAVVQAARSEADAALSGRPEGFEALAASRAAIASVRAATIATVIHRSFEIQKLAGCGGSSRQEGS